MTVSVNINILKMLAPFQFMAVFIYVVWLLTIYIVVFSKTTKKTGKYTPN